MVNCGKCGLLAMRPRTGFDLQGVPDIIRSTGLRTGHYDWHFVCSEWKGDLIEERREAEGRTFPSRDNPDILLFAYPPDGDFDLALLHVFNLERDCEEFTALRPGASPMEHRAMMDRQRMLDWQKEESRLNRESEEKIAKTAERTQTAIHGTARTTAIIQGVGIGVGALVLMVATLIGINCQPDDHGKPPTVNNFITQSTPNTAKSPTATGQP